MRGKTWTALALCALLLAGCAPAPADSSGSAPPNGSAGASGSAAPDQSAPPVSPPAPSVRVDWSRLEGETGAPQPDVDGGRWFPECTDRLVTGEDYGPLVPYLGGQAYSFRQWEYEGEIQSYYSSWPTSFYGLMTREGKIVVDPVFQSAFLYLYTWEGTWHSLPVLLLSRSAPEWEGFSNGQRYAVAAEDGSWCTEFEFLSYTNREDRLFLLRPEGCTVLDSASGARQDWSWEELGVSREELPDALDFVQWTVGLNWMDQGVCLGPVGGTDQDWSDLQLRIFDPDSGEVTAVPMKTYNRWYDAWSDGRWVRNQELVRRGEETCLVLDGQFYPLEGASVDDSFSSRAGDLVSVWSSEEVKYSLYRLSTGELLRSGDLDLVEDPARPDAPAVLIREAGTWRVYDGALRPLLSLPFASAGDWVSTDLQDGLLSLGCEGKFFGCWDLDTEKCVFFRNLGLGD